MTYLVTDAPPATATAQPSLLLRFSLTEYALFSRLTQAFIARDKVMVRALSVELDMLAARGGLRGAVQLSA